MPAWTTKPPAHILRHTFATTLIRGGTDLVIVAEPLGHSRLDTVRVYTPTHSPRPSQSTRTATHRPLTEHVTAPAHLRDQRRLMPLSNVFRSPPTTRVLSGAGKGGPGGHDGRAWQPGRRRASAPARSAPPLAPGGPAPPLRALRAPRPRPAAPLALPPGSL